MSNLSFYLMLGVFAVVVAVSARDNAYDGETPASPEAVAPAPAQGKGDPSKVDEALVRAALLSADERGCPQRLDRIWNECIRLWASSGGRFQLTFGLSDLAAWLKENT